MTRRAKLRRPVEVSHDGSRVPVGVLLDLVIRDHAGNPVAVLIDECGGNAHDKAAIPFRRLELLNRVTRGAGQAVLVETPVHLGFLRQRTRENPDRVMTAIAMARELDAFGPRQNVYARPVERGSECVRVQCLAPVAVSLLMTAPAIGGGQESLGLNEVAAFYGCVAGRRNCIGSKAKIICGPNPVSVVLPVTGVILLCPGCHQRNATRPRENSQRNEPEPCPKLHGAPPGHNQPSR